MNEQAEKSLQQPTQSTGNAVSTVKTRESNAEAVQMAKAETQGGHPVTIQTYFGTLRAFARASRQDLKLTPAVQLIYRLLIEEANCNYWQENFTCLLDDLERTTRLSRPTIVNARMILKNRGYIDFCGNPTKYTVYSLVNQEFNRELNYRAPPKTPYFNTQKQEHKTLCTTKVERQSEGGARDDLLNSSASISDSGANDEANQEALEAEFRRRYSQLQQRRNSD